MTRLIRRHWPCIVMAFAVNLLLAAALIWADKRHRTQFPEAARPATFLANDTDPVQQQIAAHPGKQLRTSRTNAQWLDLHQADRRHIAELESEVTRLRGEMTRVGN